MDWAARCIFEELYYYLKNQVLLSVCSYHKQKQWIVKDFPCYKFFLKFDVLNSRRKIVI